VTEKLSISNEVGLCIQSADACQVSITGTQTKCPLQIAPRNGLAFGQNANTNTGEKGRARETSLEITNGVGFVSAPRTFARA
jgi:hypothetical protein